MTLMTTPQGPPSPHWLDRLARLRQQVAVGLLAAGAILVVAALVLGITLKTAAVAEVIGMNLLGLACVGAGLWYYLYSEGSFAPQEAARLLVLLVGGALGLSLTIAIFGRGWQWSDTLFGGLEAWQGASGWRVWLVVGGALVGLIIMFASLLLARTEEQSNPTLRRLLYGYNAVLTGILLMIILVIVNLLSYQYIPAQTDYTDQKIYTLYPKSQNILKGLEKPVKVYVLAESPESRFMTDMQVLEDNCRNVSDQITFQNVVRDMNPRLVLELIRKFNIVDDLGLLVVYDPDGQANSTFIKSAGLYERGARQMVFRGENELMSAIDFLEQDKKKAILYFTQGNGELDMGFGEERQPDRRGSILKGRLEKDNYDVRGLRVGAADEGGHHGSLTTAPQVPEDATAVVIAGPHMPFADQAIQALDAFMNPTDPKKKKGKLIVLMDVLPASDGSMKKTGLETFLGRFSVEVGNNHILDIAGAPPNKVFVLANPALRESNPVAAALETVNLWMYEARSVQRGGPPEDRAPAAQNYQVDALLLAVASRGQGSFLWPETNLNEDPAKLADELISDLSKDNLQKIRAKRATPQMGVAVAVSEASMPQMMNPHAPKAGTPRMLVFGNARFISDADLGKTERPNYDVFASSLAWLREKPSSIGLEAQERRDYQLDANAVNNVSRMVYLPLGLMLVAVCGLGLGVWVVRRR
jgi:hypothetical protein